ncbi:MAG: hypothetical protein OEM96_02875 [Gemmatimonadota bacterium]|nr:hypothetical protein [Gemmatimonadota bacterium]
MTSTGNVAASFHTPAVPARLNDLPPKTGDMIDLGARDVRLPIPAVAVVNSCRPAAVPSRLEAAA